MACCTGQTECNHIITIGYIKQRIRQGQSNPYIQDSAGNAVSVSSSYSDDTYCPTYGELTGGTVIPTYSQGTHPKTDRDGILVSGTYTATQCVKQEDLEIHYTRFNTSSIAASPTTISACGGNSTLSYSNIYTRTMIKMNASTCASLDTTSSNVTTTSSDDIAFSITSSPRYGSIAASTYTIAKNVEPSGASRSDTVSAATTFRGTAYGSSNTVVLTQEALTGSYATRVSTYKVTTAFTGSSTTTAYTGCGSSAYTANFTRYYDVWEIKKWVDSCGKDYPDLVQSSKTSDSGSEVVTSITKNWSVIECPVSSKTDNDTITYIYTDTNHGVIQTEWTSSVNFTRTCNQTCCSAIGYKFTDCTAITPSTLSSCSGSSSFSLTAQTRCENPVGEWSPYTNFSIDWDFVSGDDFITFNDGEYTWEDNCTDAARSATYQLTMMSNDDNTKKQTCTITFNQLAGPCPDCDCGCDALEIEQTQ